MKYIFLLPALFFLQPIFSQDSTGSSEVSIHFAQTYAKFNYSTTDGLTDENLKSDIKSSYGINYSKTFSNGIFIRPELGYSNLGATSILNDQKLDWSLHYVNLSFGGGYQLSLGKLNPHIGTSIYASYLYKASQSVGVYYYDLLESKTLKKSDFGITSFVGVKYAINDNIGLLLESRYLIGLNQLEINEEGDDEKLYNRALSFHFGISVSLNK